MTNRRKHTIITFFVAVTVFLMGLLCVVSTADLIHTKLGKTICLGFGIFWALRLFIQFFVYSSELWKGKKFETVIHIIFSFLWIYLSFVFLKTSLS